MNVEEDSKAGHETGGQYLVCRAECLAFRNPVAGGRDSHIHLSVTAGHNVCQGKIARVRLLRRASAGLMDRCGGKLPPGRQRRNRWNDCGDPYERSRSSERRYTVASPPTPTRPQPVLETSLT